MRKIGVVAALVISFLFVACGTLAYAQDKKIQVNFGGGYTGPTGKVRDSLGDGGNFVAGVTFYPNPHFGIQAQYGYHAFGQKEVLIAAQPGFDSADFFAGHHMHEVAFNVIARGGPAHGGVHPYAVAGGGIYNRVVDLKSPSVGLTSVCDPYWYVCYPVAVPVETLIGDRTSTDFGINVGAGVTFGSLHAAEFYAEVRYIYIWGPKASSLVQGGILPPGVEDKNVNGQYFPISFGIRF